MNNIKIWEEVSEKESLSDDMFFKYVKSWKKGRDHLDVNKLDLIGQMDEYPKYKVSYTSFWRRCRGKRFYNKNAAIFFAEQFIKTGEFI